MNISPPSSQHVCQTRARLSHMDEVVLFTVSQMVCAEGVRPKHVTAAIGCTAEQITYHLRRLRLAGVITTEKLGTRGPSGGVRIIINDLGLAIIESMTKHQRAAIGKTVRRRHNDRITEQANPGSNWSPERIHEAFVAALADDPRGFAEYRGKEYIDNTMPSRSVRGATCTSLMADAEVKI